MANQEKQTRDEIRRLVVEPGSTISLKKDYDPGYTADFLDKGEAKDLHEEGIKKLTELQDKLYAQNSHALLIVIQAMDAAGKDGVIKHVMSGLNPQGVQVTSFKAPSAEELDHDYLWRCIKALPERGRIGIFNRSYYEEVLVVRVHPEFLKRQQLPPDSADKKIWARRYEEINNFEKYLVRNGILVLKFFLNVSRKEQKKRFLERIDLPEKNWKFSAADAQERAHWDEYMAAYEEMLNNTSTRWAPWYVIPADKKWYTRFAVATVILQAMQGLDLKYPTVDEEHKKELLKARKILENE
jgi:PPK2 family polyphosphate:nucleotide phosphotransferase